MEVAHSNNLVSPQVLDLLKTHLKDMTCTTSSTLSFVKGFVLGQLSVVVVVILVLKYLFTEDVKRVNKVKKNYVSCNIIINKSNTIIINSVISPQDYPAHHLLELMLQYHYPTIILHQKHIMI